MNDQERIEWLKERQTGIGGSDAAAVIGAHPYMTPFELWESKVEDVQEQEMSAPMKRGIVLEPVAADLYAQETGRQIRRQPMKRHPDHGHMIGNVDRQILATGNVATTGILEIKCPGLRVMANVKARGLSDYMTIQLMHYLAVYGYDWGSFALFNAENWKLIYFDLEADQDFIDMLKEREAAFWNDHVVPKIAPAIEIGDDLSLDIPEVEGELKIVDNDEWMEAARNLQEAKELLGAAGDLEEVAKEQLQEMMLELGSDQIEVDQLLRIYWNTGAGRVQWKPTAKKLAKEAKLKVDDFKVMGKPRKAFRPYFLKGVE